MTEKEAAYAYWLANVHGVGGSAAEKLLAVFGDAKAIYHARKNECKQVIGSSLAEKLEGAKKNWDVAGAYDRLRQKSIRFLPFWQDEFPKRLLAIPGKPVGIYVKGRLPDESKRTVAVVGTRNCSPYGTFLAKEFAKVLAEADVEIISGMARGIDSISQQAALDAGGRSFAVFGCGVDICYPKTGQRLYEELIQRGGVLSVYPPGTIPKPELFPPRNRIISGLSDAVLVVEAAFKSGTMITVDMALEQGREVYAVPGRLTDRCSDGCNHLIKQGAGIVLSPEDLLNELQISMPEKAKKEQEQEGTKEITKSEREILKLLDVQPKSLEQIYAQAGAFSMQEVMQILIQLCIKDYALCIDGSYYVVSRQGIHWMEKFL